MIRKGEGKRKKKIKEMKGKGSTSYEKQIFCLLYEGIFI